MPALSDTALQKLFTEARTHNAWRDQPVTDATLHQLYDLLKWGPTAANSCPLRIVFVKSAAGKEKLRPCLSPGNVDKTMAAPVTAILAWDNAFYDQLPKLFPNNLDARNWYAGKEKSIYENAFRGSSMQGGYFILAARALGLDCGPMGGFNADKVNAAFFDGSSWRANFLCNIGYGDPSGVFPRNPRLDFAEACRID
ncbi:malonic semialdehyde reductase [Permianibacter sp. IMCC34836]|uniref:malonic semialdehyde reductase n=1 Tax=Permianibacter fluminis TaxID=2738515 RepID=UPI0015534BCD|nr:malonic semialdehyde reductase [Permianibacter fluminis]NQD38510.1 malonic semialdehyde reductase [Permianibacter fluminis]